MHYSNICDDSTKKSTQVYLDYFIYKAFCSTQLQYWLRAILPLYFLGIYIFFCARIMDDIKLYFGFFYRGKKGLRWCNSEHSVMIYETFSVVLL
jgi:hypothetical protein